MLWTWEFNKILDRSFSSINTEVNAYLAELDTEMGNRKFKDAKETLAWVNQNSLPYGNYKKMFHIFNSGQYDKKLEEIGFKKSSINQFKKLSRDI